MPKFPLSLNFKSIKEAIYENFLHKKTVLNKLNTAKAATMNVGESPENCNNFFRDCCGCCSCCPVCTRTNGCVMQISVATANAACTSDPGCATVSGDFIMSFQGVGATIVIFDEGSEYKNPVDPFDGTCVWYYNSSNFNCDTANCDGCTCTSENISEGLYCDPIDPIYTSCPHSNTANEGGTCSSCEHSIHTCVADLYPGDLYPCQCSPDILSPTGYSCDCRGICNCTYYNVVSGLTIWVMVYLTEDLADIAVTVFFQFEGYSSYGQHLIPISGGADQVDCITEINSLVIPLTIVSGSAIFCTEVTSVTLDLM